MRRAGLTVNEKRVRRLMRLHGMAGRCRRRRCRTTFPGADGYVIPDLIGRRFEPGPPNGMVQDITYIPTGEGWLYLASVSISAPAGCSATRWPITCAPNSSSTRSAWPSPPAAAHGGRRDLHADRGSQYTSNDYLEFCHTNQLRPSVGRTGVMLGQGVGFIVHLLAMVGCERVWRGSIPSS